MKKPQIRRRKKKQRHNRESADFPGWWSPQIKYICYLCPMKSDLLLRAILLDVLIDDFDVANFVIEKEVICA